MAMSLISLPMIINLWPWSTKLAKLELTHLQRGGVLLCSVGGWRKAPGIHKSIGRNAVDELNRLCIPDGERFILDELLQKMTRKF